MKKIFAIYGGYLLIIIFFSCKQKHVVLKEEYHQLTDSVL